MNSDIIAFIGNGFDLSLGLKTSYCDFFDKCWQSFDSFTDIGLKASLSNQRKECRWFDLEKAISDYVHNTISNISEFDSEIANKDVLFYDSLVDKLGEYLRGIQNNALHFGNFMAEEIMKAMANKTIDFIFTFNYTDIVALAEKKGIEIDKEIVNHLHGDTYNPILGITDFSDKNLRIHEPYCRWIKSWNINYSSHAVAGRLIKAKEVIFYGLSFGAIDYIYFRDFFNYINNSDFSASEQVIIDIITKDYNSQIEIFSQLRDMGIDINTLMAKCNFNIIRIGNNEGLDSHSMNNYDELKKRLAPLKFDEWDNQIY